MTMTNDDEFRKQAMNRKQAQGENRRSETFGDSFKRDNLNGGRMRQEYIDEITELREQAENHTLKMSDDFLEWQADRFANQGRERKEQVQRIRERLFPERESKLTPMDEAIHEQGESANYYRDLREWKKAASEKLFPEKETERRRDERENKRHPMDVMMREQLAERRRRNGGF